MLSVVSSFIVSMVCTAQCKSEESKSAQPTDREGATGQIVALTSVSSILQSAVAYPRWPLAAVTEEHRSPSVLASKLPTFMQICWISEDILNGTGLQC